MGWRPYDVSTRAAHDAAVAASGRATFHHDAAVRSGRASGVHDLLNPKQVAGPTSPFAGRVMRESVAPDANRIPTSIALWLDVTGSNIKAARAAHAKLPLLYGVLQRGGYVAHPNIMVGAIGDIHSDVAPLQVGQFEAGNELDEQIEAMYLEGNGGGQMRESYELGLYFLAYHTYLEAFEKYGRKGYAFFIGDEMPYDAVRRFYHHSVHGHSVESLMGDTLEEDIPIEELLAIVQERYEVFFLFQAQSEMYGNRIDEILPTWQRLLGERALILEDPSAVCELIAMTIGMFEKGYDLNQTAQDLMTHGADSAAVQAAGNALVPLMGSASPAVYGQVDGNLPDTTDDEDGSSRL